MSRFRSTCLKICYLLSVVTLGYGQAAFYLKNDSTSAWHCASGGVPYTLSLAQSGDRGTLWAECSHAMTGRQTGFLLRPGELAKVDYADPAKPRHSFALALSDQCHQNPCGIHLASDYLSMDYPGGVKRYLHTKVILPVNRSLEVDQELINMFIMEGDTLTIRGDSYAPVVNLLAAQSGLAPEPLLNLPPEAQGGLNVLPGPGAGDGK